MKLRVLREALADHGVTQVDVHPVTYDGDLVEKDQPWCKSSRVANGYLDVAAVWGPFAGYVKAKKGRTADDPARQSHGR